MAFGFTTMGPIGQRMQSMGLRTPDADALARQGAEGSANGAPAGAAPTQPTPQSAPMVQTPQLPQGQAWNPNGVNLPPPNGIPTPQAWNPGAVNLPQAGGSVGSDAASAASGAGSGAATGAASSGGIGDILAAFFGA